MFSRYFVVFFSLVLTCPVMAAQLPPSEMETLAEGTLHVPQDLTGKPTLVILAFAHEQREESGRVSGLLQEANKQNPQLDWYEFPIIDAPLVAHMFIKNGMRSHTDEALHAHIVPQFVDEEEWRKASGITATEPVLVKVNSQGDILKMAPSSTIKSVTDVSKF